jgi:hypothetical protein
VEHYAEQCSARGVYTGLDLFVGYDHRTLANESRDLTAFDTPLGTCRLTVLPQGYTGSLAIFHADVTFILQAEIEIAPNFSDDVTVLGPKTRYETEDGGYEAMEGNPGVRRFIWEHLNDVNRVLHRLKHAGATVSAGKLKLCVPELEVVGQLSTYEGRIPEKGKVVKVETWPECKTASDVRGFLGMAGTVRSWIKDFASIALPLVKLTKKNIVFSWTDIHRDAMEKIKTAVTTCPAIRPIDYTKTWVVYLAVDA